MAEGREETGSQGDSLSDDDSWEFHIDMPENDQTWLFCPSWDDPNRVVDLTDFFCIRESTPQERSKLKGLAFDSRTFTRPKRHTLNTPNPAFLTSSLQSSKLTQPLSRSLSEGNLKNFLEHPLNKNASLEVLLLNSSNDRSQVSMSSIKILKLYNCSFLNKECTLINDVSCPSSFFATCSLTGTPNQTLNKSCFFKSMSETIYQSAQSQFRSKVSEKESSGKDEFNSFLDDDCLNTPRPHSSTKYLKFKKCNDPNLNSTPKSTHIKTEPVSPKALVTLKNSVNIESSSNDAVSTVDTVCNSSPTSLNETYFVIDLLNTTTTPLQATKDVFKNNNNTFTLEDTTLTFENTKLTSKSLKKSNDSLTIRKNNSNQLRKHSTLEISDSSLLENTSCPSGFYDTYSSGTGSETLSRNDNESCTHEIKSKADQTANKAFRHGTKDTRIQKRLTSDQNINPNAYMSPENYSEFCFQPALVSTPKVHKPLTNLKEPIRHRGNVHVIAEECSPYLGNETLKPTNAKTDIDFNTTITINDNEGALDKTITIDNNNMLEKLDKNNANYLPGEYRNPVKTTSVESVYKPMKVMRERDDDSAPDSCYSSASNIRSLGDFCGPTSQNENINQKQNMRKSISHDSLLSQESYKQPSCSKSEMNLNQRSPVKGKRSLLKPMAWDRNERFRTSIPCKQGSTASFKNLESENKNHDETFCLENVHHNRPSQLKPPAAVSKIPMMKTKIPTFQSRKSTLHK